VKKPHRPACFPVWLPGVTVCVGSVASFRLLPRLFAHSWLAFPCVDPAAACHPQPVGQSFNRVDLYQSVVVSDLRMGLRFIILKPYNRCKVRNLTARISGFKNGTYLVFPIGWNNV